MKIRFHSSLLRLVLLTGLFTFASVSLHAGGDGTTTSVKLSIRDKPATFKIDVSRAKINLIGTEGDTVTVTSLTGENDGKQCQGDGLRRLDDDISFALVENDHVVSLTTGGDHPVLKIVVPRAIAVDFRPKQGADLMLKNISGGHRDSRPRWQSPDRRYFRIIGRGYWAWRTSRHLHHCPNPVGCHHIDGWRG